MLSWVSFAVGSSTGPGPRPIGRPARPNSPAAIVVSVQILVAFEVAVALHQPESARIGVAEVRHGLVAGLRSGRQIHSPVPDCISRPSESCTSGRKSSEGAPVVLALEEHRGQRGDSHTGQSASREQRHGDIEGRRFGGIDDEPVGSGDGRAVEQRIDGRMVRIRAGHIDPELPEQRELLGLRPAATPIARPRAERP